MYLLTNIAQTVNVLQAMLLTKEDKMDAFNDFGKEETVNIKKFKDYRKGNKDIQINLPSKSVVLLTLIKT